jgi:carbon-monoxide dehydrogenase medium subunit
VKPAPFAYAAPRTLDEALALLARHGEDAKPLAGGQSLLPVLNFRLARPSLLIDLNRIDSLAGIDTAGDTAGADVRARDQPDPQRGAAVLRIGALTRQRVAERSTLVAAHAPLLAETLPHVAHVQIRNRGTIGGSLAHADPAAELPAVALALEARMVLRRAAEERVLEARGFFTGLFSTALQTDELLVAVEVPALPARTGCAFLEVARRHGDYALLAVAAVIGTDASGTCREARLAYVNAGPGPQRSPRAEALLRGQQAADDVFRACGDAAVEDLRPPTDVHASADYRLHLARVLTRRAVALAFRRTMATGFKGSP